MSSELAYVNSFIRYSDRSAEGGCIKANGDYSFGMEDHPARVHNARLEKVELATHGFTLLHHETDVNFDGSRGRGAPLLPGSVPAGPRAHGCVGSVRLPRASGAAERLTQAAGQP